MSNPSFSREQRVLATVWLAETAHTGTHWAPTRTSTFPAASLPEISRKSTSKEKFWILGESVKRDRNSFPRPGDPHSPRHGYTIGRPLYSGHLRRWPGCNWSRGYPNRRRWPHIWNGGYSPGTSPVLRFDGPAGEWRPLTGYGESGGRPTRSRRWSRRPRLCSATGSRYRRPAPSRCDWPLGPFPEGKIPPLLEELLCLEECLTGGVAPFVVEG